MDMTEKNGQPSMEEILASIRRIVAEEPEAQIPHGASAPIIDFRNNPITLNGDGVLDDSSEFDLPAIFRSSSTQQPEKPGPLIGRLTDAIRNATSSQSEPKQQPEVRPMHVVEDNSERGDEPSVGRFGVQSESYPALSTLKPVASAQDTPESRRSEAAQAEAKPASQGWNFSRPSSPPPAAVNEEIKRVMAPFKDTHFTRMSSAGTGRARRDRRSRPDTAARAPAPPPPQWSKPRSPRPRQRPSPRASSTSVPSFRAVLTVPAPTPQRPRRQARSGSRHAPAPSTGPRLRPRLHQRQSRWRPERSSRPSRPPIRRLLRITTKLCRRCRRRSLSFHPKCRTLLMQRVSQQVRLRIRRQSCCAPCCALGFPTTCRAWSKRHCTSRWPRVSGPERSRPTRDV